jgi:long-chain acyl-CoA synthetase
MADFENIAQRVLRKAEEQGDQAAFILPSRQVTYARIQHLTLAFAQHLKLNGIGRDCLVAIDIENVVSRPVAALACALVGASWADGSPAVVQDRKLPYTHVLFGEAKAHKHRPAANRIMVDASWSDAPPGTPYALDPSGPEDIWAYGQSSGTTGAPKFRAIRHGLLAATPPQDGGIQERSVIALIAPPGVRGTTTIVAATLARGGTLVTGDFDLMVRSGVMRIGGSPVQFARFLEGAPKPAKRIHSAEMSGAAPAESLLERMLEYFEEVQNYYGTSEIGLVTQRTITSLPVDPANVGTLRPNYELMLVDAEDNPVPAGQEGIVRIRRTDRPLTGYIDPDEAAKRIYRDGWFYPGDIGRLADNGDLYIVGRTDDRLNVGGVKVDAGRVDVIIQNIPGVRDGYCFEDRDAAGASYLALLLDLYGEVDPSTVVQEFHDTMNASGLYYRFRRVYLAREIPRTPTGKPVRRIASEFVREQKLINIALQEPRSV